MMNKYLKMLQKNDGSFRRFISSSMKNYVEKSGKSDVRDSMNDINAPLCLFA